MNSSPSSPGTVSKRYSPPSRPLTRAGHRDVRVVIVDREPTCVIYEFEGLPGVK